MADPLLTHRVESWRYDLLTRTEAPLTGPEGLAGVLPGGSVSWSAGSTFQARGEIEVVDVGQVEDLPKAWEPLDPPQTIWSEGFETVPHTLGGIGFVGSTGTSETYSGVTHSGSRAALPYTKAAGSPAGVATATFTKTQTGLEVGRTYRWSMWSSGLDSQTYSTNRIKIGVAGVGETPWMTLASAWQPISFAFTATATSHDLFITGDETDTDATYSWFRVDDMLLEATTAWKGLEDWLDLRLRIWHQVAGAEPWPLGTFIITGFPEQITSTGRSWRLALTDKLIRLDQDGTAESVSLPAGTVVTTAVRDQIAAAGETAVAITDSTRTLASGQVWEAGTSRLRIINDLLAGINYWSLRTDRFGRYVAAPYSRPQDRDPIRDLTADAIVLAEWEREQDIASIPNRVVLRTSGSGDTPGLVAVAENTDPDSRFSIPSRGVIVAPDRDTAVEADSQATLDALAARRLADLSAPAGMRTIQHAGVPLDVNDVVLHKGTRGAVTEWTQRLATGELMNTTLREI